MFYCLISNRISYKWSSDVSNREVLQTKKPQKGQTALGSVFSLHTSPVSVLTVEFGGEAEGVVALVLLVSVPVVPHSSRVVLAPALVSGVSDGVLHRPILQPARITPVQPLQPRLLKDTLSGSVGPTRSLSITKNRGDGSSSETQFD